MDVRCDLCPRRCHAARGADKPGGICRSPLTPQVARAAPHYGEEPCIAGKNGTGAVWKSAGAGAGGPSACRSCGTCSSACGIWGWTVSIS